MTQIEYDWVTLQGTVRVLTARTGLKLWWLHGPWETLVWRRWPLGGLACQACQTYQTWHRGCVCPTSRTPSYPSSKSTRQSLQKRRCRGDLRKMEIDATSLTWINNGQSMSYILILIIMSTLLVRIRTGTSFYTSRPFKDTHITHAAQAS